MRCRRWCFPSTRADRRCSFLMSPCVGVVTVYTGRRDEFRPTAIGRRRRFAWLDVVS